MLTRLLSGPRGVLTLGVTYFFCFKFLIMHHGCTVSGCGATFRLLLLATGITLGFRWKREPKQLYELWRWCLGWEVWYSGLRNLEAVGFHGWGALETECRQVSFKVPQLICWKLGDPGFPWTKKMRTVEGGCELQYPGISCSHLPQALSWHLDSSLNIENNRKIKISTFALHPETGI